MGEIANAAGISRLPTQKSYRTYTLQRRPPARGDTPLLLAVAVAATTHENHRSRTLVPGAEAPRTLHRIKSGSHTSSFARSRVVGKGGRNKCGRYDARELSSPGWGRSTTSAVYTSWHTGIQVEESGNAVPKSLA
ncbi:hypothetical protein MTO96_009840 [Rhipicephalus appendiculatus]